MAEAETKRCLITGITGMDGSHLADFLLERGHDVYGMVRRSSTVNFDRIRHIQDRVTLLQGDLLDQSSLMDVLRAARPHEVYNLAAQSFVPTSWQQPVLTGEFTGLGVTRLLEAIRSVDPSVKFYQASSSEMFGRVREVPQRETTSFYPRSPYGVAKAYAHYITVNYRESYGLYAVSGILFNHECLAENTPLLVKYLDQVDVVPVVELVPLMRKGRSVQTFETPDLTVWDGQDWVKVRAITATHRRTREPDHDMLSVEARAGVAQVTAHHRMLSPGRGCLPARQVGAGDLLLLADRLPSSPGWTVLTTEMAELLGLLVAEGFVARGGGVRFTNNDPALRGRVAELWSRLFLGSSYYWEGRSGWDPTQPVGQLALHGPRALAAWLRSQLYLADGHKRVPPLILNATPEIQRAFLEGYYAGDGLQAGSGDSIKTNSAVLAQGLCWLYANQGRECSVYAEQRGAQTYYQLNVFSANPRGAKGRHLRKAPAEVRRVVPCADPPEWVFDLETESGHLMAGVGRLIVHNSPRRGLEFVTHKITHHVAKIKLGLARELRLGNLDARRDWGYAGDYVRAMWLMLQQPDADDYVIATGDTHSVREFCELAFDYAGLDWREHVVVDPSLIRPAEVDHLVGDASKAGRVLGWEPTVTFPQLVRLMVDADLAALARGREA